MDIFNVLMVAGAALALYLVNAKSYWGFVVFLFVVEPIYILIGIRSGEYGLIATESLYISLYIHGLWKWKSEENKHG